ncbi:MAG: 16S rRNA (guanine(966)-N(2))-methyltransferase RsmD [Pseudomonadota bacterium]
MRIIAGRFRGRRLQAPAGVGTRPSSDRLREALFNLLAHRPGPPLENALIGDFFAGTGALGLEALSRGARHAFFVEPARQALAALRANIARLGVGGQSTVHAIDARRLPPAAQALDFLFLDPPYGQGLALPALERAMAQGWLKSGSLIIVEAGRDEALDWPAAWRLLDRRVYGQGVVYLVHNF